MATAAPLRQVIWEDLVQGVAVLHHRAQVLRAHIVSLGESWDAAWFERQKELHLYVEYFDGVTAA